MGIFGDLDEDNEGMEGLLKTQLRAVMVASVDLAVEMVPKFGKMYKGLYDSLIEEGFTEEQAMRIVCNYNPSLPK